MSTPLEQRTCPDCGAIFYLIPGVEAELPPHGCLEPVPQPESSAQPAPDSSPASAAQSESDHSAASPGLFHALQDQAGGPKPPDPAPPTGRGELKDDTAKSLRERGYVLTEDVHGVRITGSPRGGSAGSTLSPSDIVRIAAEMDGGIKQVGTLQTCPKCQARTPAGEAKCQWCGEPFPAPR